MSRDSAGLSRRHFINLVHPNQGLLVVFRQQTAQTHKAQFFIGYVYLHHLQLN